MVLITFHTPQQLDRILSLVSSCRLQKEANPGHTQVFEVLEPGLTEGRSIEIVPQGSTTWSKMFGLSSVTARWLPRHDIAIKEGHPEAKGSFMSCFWRRAASSMRHQSPSGSASLLRHSYLRRRGSPWRIHGHDGRSQVSCPYAVASAASRADLNATSHWCLGLVCSPDGIARSPGR